MTAISLIKKAPAPKGTGANEHFQKELPRQWRDPAQVFSFGHVLADIERTLRKVVREELRAQQDRQTFAAASGLMTIEEACEYLRMSRAELSRRRVARKVAKGDAEKDAAFAPEYHSGKNTKFKRAELDAWLERQKQ